MLRLLASLNSASFASATSLPPRMSKFQANTARCKTHSGARPTPTVPQVLALPPQLPSGFSPSPPHPRSRAVEVLLIDIGTDIWTAIAYALQPAESKLMARRPSMLDGCSVSIAAIACVARRAGSHQVNALGHLHCRLRLIIRRQKRSAWTMLRSILSPSIVAMFWSGWCIVGRAYRSHNYLGSGPPLCRLQFVLERLWLSSILGWANRYGDFAFGHLRLLGIHLAFRSLQPFWHMPAWRAWRDGCARLGFGPWYTNRAPRAGQDGAAVRRGSLHQYWRGVLS